MSSSSGLSSTTFNDYNTHLQGSALKATRAAVSLPADIPFHRSVHPEFAKEVDRCSSRVLALTNKLLHLASSANPSLSSRGKGKGRLEVQDDVLDNFHSLVVDSMDQLLERADIGLDEFLGNIKPPAIAVSSAPIATTQKKKSTVVQGRLDPALQHASYLAKPQLAFKRKPDNRSHIAWAPTLRHKYNARVPLGYNYSENDEEGLSTSIHPYRYEIKHISYPARMFTSATPIPPRSFDETPFTWVSTSDVFAIMLDKLRGAHEVAVDLEYHSYRTFGGFVCLMQISTREEDFVVDTLALRDEMEELNEVFTNPDVVKVFHGAESDIVWLQQDFNIYVVNLFDTYHASKVLDFPRHGLATLLEMYCDFTADKRYQLADWRIRPLPEEMLQYARSDTHFLLFIYDHLRNALLDRAESRAQSRAQSPSSSSSTPAPDATVPPAHVLVREVLSRSEETAMRVYEKETYDAEGGTGPGGWDTLARKWNKSNFMASSTIPAGSAAGAQRAVYLAVHAWRDRIAREEDESTRYVLPNHYLFALAERTPGDMAALLAVFHPVPPVIRRRAKELLDTIRQAVKSALSAPGITEESSGESSVETADAPMAVDRVEDAITFESSISDPTHSLWSRVSTITAVQSTLFGSSLQRKAVEPLPIAQRSALFGRQSYTQREQAPDSATNRARFLEAATRIHSKLVIAPTVPNVIHTTTSASSGVAPASAAMEDESVLKVEGQAEVAFVPLSQRTTAQAPPIDDTIVVVGQRKAKSKRKRERAAEKGEASNLADTSPKQEEAEVEAFDYASVSNILDDGSDHEGDKPSAKKRQKHAKGSNASFYGNFPAAPKAHSQLKTGNQSRTFR